MMGSVDFRYDTTNDLVVAVPRWVIETPDDVRAWYEQYASYFEANFKRPVDVIIVLDDFHIKASVAVLWGEHRAKIHQRFTRYSFRVHSDSHVRLFVDTSGARYDVSTLEAATVDGAIEGIKALRERPKAEQRAAAAP